MSERRQKSQKLPRVLILAGLLVAVLAILALKEKPAPQTAEINGETPLAQLNQALDAGLPVLAFYHSNNCQSCIEMIAIVDQVYPEFQEEVVLVDVNVYDERNQALLQAVGLRFIPTQMLYDRSGKHQTVTGVMQPEQLREALTALSQGK